MKWLKKLFGRDKYEHIQVQLPNKKEIQDIKERTGLDLLGIEASLVRSFGEVVREHLKKYESTEN